MKEDEVIRKLASRAKREAPPRIDVTNQVMAALHRRESLKAPGIAPLAWISAASVAAAIIMVLLSIPAWQTATSPLLEIFIDLPAGLL